MEANQANILVELECVVCTEYMHPPIRMCVSGHSFCDKCAKRMVSCPECRRDKSEARNFALENIHDKIIIPCKHRNQGCDFQNLGVHTKDHEEFCKYTRRRCPLITISNCIWNGPVMDFVQHCKEMHPDNVYCTSQKHLSCPRLRSYGVVNPQQPGDDYCMLFEAYGRLFKFVWDLNPMSGFMRWCLMYLGPKADAVKFSYEIEFKNEKAEADAIQMSATCQPFLCPGLQSGKYLLTHVDMLRRFCSEFGLCYKVTIFNNEGLPKLEDCVGNGDVREGITTPQASRFYHFNDPNLDGVRRLLRVLRGDDMDDEIGGDY